jgi:hypothetical protein
MCAYQLTNRDTLAHGTCSAPDEPDAVFFACRASIDDFFVTFFRSFFSAAIDDDAKAYNEMNVRVMYVTSII